MKFEIHYNEKGEPAHVTQDTGFLISSGPFDPKEHGRMLNQLDPADFPAIQTGRDMEYLVREVNQQRRQLWTVTEQREMYTKAAGF
jgi:hypothetical protein